MAAPNRTPTPSDVAGLVAPLLAVAALLALLGRSAGATIALVAGAVAANAVVADPTIPGRVRRGRHRAGHRIGSGLRVGLGAATYVVFFLPVWAFRRVRRAPWLTSPGWAAANHGTTASEPARTFAGAPIDPGERTTRTRTAFAAIGVVALLLAVDLGAGLAWERAVGDHDGGSSAGMNEAVAGTTGPDPRADAPAMADATWRARYFDELRALRTTYWPYVLTRPTSSSGRYINIDGWDRRTWEPPGSSAERPAVWLLGGSAAWGEGQRDQHTIASEVARLAAADGLAIEARNLAQRGWVLYQSVTLYDQLLIDPAEGAPDLALFLDGAADVAVQAQRLPGGGETRSLAVPMHYGVEEVVRQTASTTSTASEPSPDPVGGAWNAYVRHSLVAKALRGVTGLASPDPTAAATSDDCVACSAPPVSEEIGPEAVAKAVAVYRQDRAIARDISRRHGVTARFFWQPSRLGVREYRAAAEEVGSPTVDLTAVLDAHQDDYLDLVHTNEAGARRVAAAIYASIRPDLVRWYRAHGHRP